MRKNWQRVTLECVRCRSADVHLCQCCTATERSSTAVQELGRQIIRAGDRGFSAVVQCLAVRTGGPSTAAPDRIAVARGLMPVRRPATNCDVDRSRTNWVVAAAALLMSCTTTTEDRVTDAVGRPRRLALADWLQSDVGLPPTRPRADLTASEHVVNNV